MMVDLGLIVEGHCEYDSFPSILSKIPLTPHYVPILNAGGIGNIIKNVHEQLLDMIKTHAPKKIVITLDYRDALRDGSVENCIQLKEIVTKKCQDFMNSQTNGSLNLPDNIVVVIADKTFESWICADIISLRKNENFDAELLIEDFKNVDLEIENPTSWLESKLLKDVDIKNRRNRVKIYKCIDPDVARTKSRSFDKFYREVTNTITFTHE
ncbi:DUF4276 family protein [Chryseobacterium shandongense]|uniref:DUF4276 family protein n=1 Tax=Chryseobacterium shandongense TaxID=1493872 RepID=UPI000F4EDBFC|nr:DUF4276 family protein [Chryseobacterium shandongense]AZA58071.1 DUF4276 family protein [Chryseobacterium shandongense]